MARQYPLLRLLRLRQIREDQAAAQLALSARRAQQADARADRAQTQFLGTELVGETNNSVWTSMVAARMAGRSIMTDAMALAQAAHQERDEKANDFRAAHTEVTILEKLEERFIAQQRAEEDRAENVFLDEIAQRSTPDSGPESGPDSGPEGTSQFNTSQSSPSQTSPYQTKNQTTSGDAR